MSVTFNSVNRYGYKYGVSPSSVGTTDMNQSPIYSKHALHIEANVSSTNGITSIKVKYKNASSTDYKSVDMVLNNQAPYYIDWQNSNYNSIIPHLDIGTEDLVYYVEVTDNGNVVYPSNTYQVSTASAPYNIRSAFWVHERMHTDKNTWIGNIFVDEDNEKLTAFGTGLVPYSTSDLQNWSFDGKAVINTNVGSIPNGYAYGSLPIPTSQGKKWLYIGCYIEGANKTDPWQENRIFYHLDDNPYLDYQYPAYDDPTGSSFWTPVQNSLSLKTNGDTSSLYGNDFYFMGLFFLGQPVIRDGYMYMATWINTSYANRVGTGGGENNQTIANIRIMRIKVDDMLLGKQFETYKTFETTYFEHSCSESYLLDDKVNNLLYIFVRGDGSKHTYISVMDWNTGIWHPAYDAWEGLPAKGWIDDDGEMFVVSQQRDYSAEIPTGENSTKVFLYRHLPTKPYNQWETREEIANLVNSSGGSPGYGDVKRFKGHLVIISDAGLLYNVLDQYYKSPKTAINHIKIDTSRGVEIIPIYTLNNITNNNLRIYTNDQKGCFELVDISDVNASEIKIYINGVKKALYK